MSTEAQEDIRKVGVDWLVRTGKQTGSAEAPHALAELQRRGMDHEGRAIANDNARETPKLALVPRDEVPPRVNVVVKSLANSVEAVNFAEQWRKATGAPVCLTAIPVDPETHKRGTPIAKTFTDADGITGMKAAQDWVLKYNGNANLYFQFNERMSSAADKSKAGKADMKCAYALQGDLDARVNEPQDEAINRILKKLESYNPKPSIIVVSGGGCQAYWLLAEPFAINGDVKKAQELERYTRQLERDLDGDKTHNVDRIMRLAFTKNIPDETKIKKGRKPAVAYVHRADWNLKYPLSAFKQVADDSATVEPPRVAGPGARDEAQGKAAVVRPEPPVTDIEDPRVKDLSEHLKRIQVHGRDADSPGDDGSDSGPLFAYLKGCVRAKKTDSLMAVIITDKRWGVSAHIMKQSNPRNAALRQIAKARKAVARDTRDEEALRAAFFAELNIDNFVIGNIGGRTRIGSFVRQHGRDVLSITTVSDFANRHPQPMLKCEWSSRPRPGGEVWAKSLERKFYTSLTYEPCGPGVTADGRLNLWRGWGIEPRKGNWKRLRKHIWETVAKRDRKAFKYIIRWLAWSVQHPDKPAQVVLAFIGAQGAGKGILGRTHNSFYGPQHSRHVSNLEDVTGRFNSVLQDCSALFLDEAHLPKDEGHRGNLYRLITEDTLSIERKGVDREFESPNCLHIIVATNHDRVAIERGDRRFALFEVSDAHKDDRAHFKLIYDELESGGRAAMLYDLLRVKLGDWHPNPAPKTEAHRRQRALNLEPTEVFIERLLQDQRLPGASKDRPDWCLSHGEPDGRLGLLDKSRLGEIDRRLLNGSDKALTLALTRYGATAQRDSTGNHRGWQFASPAECRARWEKHHGPWAWDDVAQGQWGDVPKGDDNAQIPF